ncbi:hypothetical protein Tco_0205739 [Tanacetum coccineum]
MTTRVVLELEKEVAVMGPRVNKRRRKRAKAGTTCVTPATQEALLGAKSVSDSDPLSYARPQPHTERDMAQ